MFMVPCCLGAAAGRTRPGLGPALKEPIEALDEPVLLCRVVLRGVVEREQAALGVLLTLNAPTKAIRTEATSGGFYASPCGQHPRVQILTGRTPGRKKAGRAAAALDQPDLQAGTEGSEENWGAAGDVWERFGPQPDVALYTEVTGAFTRTTVTVNLGTPNLNSTRPTSTK